MRPFLSFFLFAALTAAQTPPVVGVLDFYGLNKLDQAKIRKTLGFQEGDPFPRSKGDVEEKLDEITGVVESHLEAVCCDAGKMVLYIGIEERGAAHFDLREAPETEVTLPDDVIATFRRFQTALDAAARRGSPTSLAEDLTHGHSLMADRDTRAIQEQFPAIVKEHTAELRDVMKNALDEEQRAIATYVIAYAAGKGLIVNDLQFALKDADAGVRSTAVSALMAVAVYAKLHPDANVKVEPTWFVEMLNSLSWSDRDHALLALQILTDGRDPIVLEQIRERALAALVEMARWKTLAHALPAFVLTGRVAGLSETQIQDAWTRGDREAVITAALNRKKAR